MDYKGTCQSAGIEFQVAFSVENGEIERFEPEGLKSKLHGDALLAYRNYQNLLRGVVYQLPTRIKEVYRTSEEVDVPIDISMPSL